MHRHLMDKELNALFEALQKNEETDEKGVVRDGKLKKRVAKFCLDLLQTIPAGDDEKRQDACYTIAGFMQFQFDDALEDITSLAGELELPTAHMEGNPSEMLKNLKTMLEKYLR